MKMYALKENISIWYDKYDDVQIVFRKLDW